MALISVGAGVLAALAVVIGYIGWAHKQGSMNFFGKKKTGANVGIALMLVAAIFAVGAFSPGTLSDIGLDGIIQPPSEALSFGNGAADEAVVTTTAGFTIETLSVSAKEAGSNSAANADGVLRIYDAGTNPSSATAQALDSIDVNDGVGSSTDKVLKEGAQYRVVWDGNGSSYYDKDFGVMAFSGLNPNTGVLSFDAGAITKVATLDDILDETSATGKVNGQTTAVNATANEIVGAADSADTTLYYDESNGDGQWYVEVTPSASGAHAVARSAVLAFEHDSTNPPEGNEYSQIVAQHIQGSVLNIPSDVTDYWKNELPIELGDMSAGTSATYRLTFSVEEANEDANDDWKLHFDDLGDYREKDIRLDAKASPDTITYGGSQA